MADFDIVLHDLTKQFFQPGAPSVSTKINLTSLADKNEKSYTGEMLHLLALIPNKVFGCHNYSFTASANSEGKITLGYQIDNQRDDYPFIQSCLDMLNDNFAAITESQLIDGQWNEQTQTLSISNTDALYDIILEMQEDLLMADYTMGDIIISSAASIQERYYPDAVKDIETLSKPEEQFAIVRAVKTVVASFDDTDDFTVVASEHHGRYYFEVTLGKNSDISFEKRFKTLQDVFDSFESKECLCPTATFEKWPCLTGFGIGFDSPKDCFPIIKSLFEEHNINNRACYGQIPLFISLGELYAVTHTDLKAAREFKPYQH